MDVPPLKPERRVRDELRALLRLAVPIVISQVGMILLGTCDTVMVGRISKAALDAVFFGNLYYVGTLVFGTGVIMVLDPLISQAWGAGDKSRVSLTLHRSIVVSLALSVPFAILFQNSESILLWLCRGDREVAEIANTYVRWLTPSIPAWFLFVAFRQTLQAMSVLRPLLLSVLVGNVVNVVLNYAFIHGKWGAPALGAPGTAISTTIGRWLMVVVIAGAGWPALARVWQPPTRALLALRPYGVMLVKGLQTGFQVALEVWVFNFVALLVIRMGQVEGAAQAPVYNLISLAFMVPFGIAGAAATRVGNALGRGDPIAARLSAFTALATGAAVTTVSASLFAMFPGPIVRLYIDDPEVVALAITLLRITAVFQVFDGTQAVGCGVLRGAGDTKAAAVINLVGYWFVGLPIGMFLTYSCGVGPGGLWWGLTIALAVVAALLVLRIRKALGRDPAAQSWVLARETER